MPEPNQNALEQPRSPTAPGAPDAAGVATSGGRWGWLRAAVGVVMLGSLVYAMGNAEMLQQLATLGWWAPLLIVPYGIFALLDVKAWQCVFPRAGARPSLWYLYAVRLAGEAVNDFTPTAYMGGEPVKAYLLRRAGVSTTDAIASVMVAKTTLTAGQILFIVMGFALLVVRAHPSTQWVLALGGVALGSYGFVAALVYWQRRGLLGSVARVLQRVTAWSHVVDRFAAHGRDVDRAVAVFYVERRRDFYLSIFLHWASWALGTAELLALIWLVGQQANWLDVTIVEALNQPVKAAGLVVPGTIGVQEAGGMLAFALMGVTPQLGLTVMLLRRVREIFYGLLGLLILRRLSHAAPTDS